MIGEKIPKTDEHWSNFLCLLDIVDYLLAPILSKDCTSHLKELIKEHHEAFRELYPSSNITPKMHYMVHYPDCIQRCVNKSTRLFITESLFIVVLSVFQFHHMHSVAPPPRCLHSSSGYNNVNTDTVLYLYIQVWATCSIMVHAL